MSFHRPDDSPAPSLPSPPKDVYLRPESISLDDDTDVARGNSHIQSHRHSTLSFGTTLPGTPSNELYADEKANSFLWESSGKNHEERIKALGDLNTMVEEKPDFSDPDGMKVRRAQRLMKVRKFAFQSCIFGLKYGRVPFYFLRSTDQGTVASYCLARGGLKATITSSCPLSPTAWLSTLPSSSRCFYG